jgi:hypothetical protein
VKLEFDRTYLASCMVLFAVETYIACGMNDALIRPYGGDALVVVLLYTGIRSCIRAEPRRVVAAVFAFACVVEMAQHHQLVTRLGLDHSSLARTVIGTSFDWGDIVAYAAGCLCTLVVEAHRTSLGGERR